MPVYRIFYVERRTSEGWGVPPGFDPEPRTFEADRPFGGFTWAHPRSPWLELFWGTAPLFPVRTGAPDERRGSPLLRYLDQWYDYTANEDRLCWLPYSDLVVDLWHRDTVLVEGKIAARYARIFGDGRLAFPQKALVEMGASKPEMERLSQGKRADESLDATFGQHRARLADLSPDELVLVTWRATLAEFIGAPHANLFIGLRGYGPDEDLRILSRTG